MRAAPVYTTYTPAYVYARSHNVHNRIWQFTPASFAGVGVVLGNGPLLDNDEAADTGHLPYSLGSKPILFSRDTSRGSALIRGSILNRSEYSSKPRERHAVRTTWRLAKSRALKPLASAAIANQSRTDTPSL